MDKIKEANKELFANDVEDNDELVPVAQINRKVSFAANLEEYEPQNGINLKELQEKLGQDNVEDDEENSTNADAEQKLEVINEEDAPNEDEVKNEIEINSHDKDTENESPAEMNDKETTDTSNENEVEIETETSEKVQSVDENEIIEEICEEIQIMDMENDKSEVCEEKKSDSPRTVQRRILKQITFDCTEEDESDNKSLTNLLISDNEVDSGEDDDENVYQEYNCNASVHVDSDNEDDKFPCQNEENYEEDEDDDKLSIIVASYLPDDMACDKTSLTSSSMRCSPRVTKARKLPFNKRFSFRRKTKSSNANASSSNHHSTGNRRFMPPPEVTDLKLHYKTCCDYKNVQLKLPKYTGYLSEYGLSQEQLIERERKLQQKQHGKKVQTLKSSEAEIRKMHDNEKAFTTWLKNKMRYPINKTRNMFDVKRPFGLRKCTSVGGNALLNDETKQPLSTTKYRSISAKFRKT